MKKLIALFLIIVLTASFVSCTSANENSMQITPVEEQAKQNDKQEQKEESVAEQEPEAVESEELADTKSEQPSQNVDKAAEYSKIPQSEAKKLMDEQNPIVIDVREDYEYEEKHITGAILSPLGNIHNDITNLTDDKDALILIYCRSGNRSRTATEILVDMGYTNVHDFGGIIDWAYEVDR